MSNATDIGLRVMLFQIDIKHFIFYFCKIFMFESNVILDRYKTNSSTYSIRNLFESNVILDRYKTYTQLI